MKHICVIADGYPYGQSNHCVFVRDLVVQLAQAGVQCTVIAPQMRIGLHKSSLPYKWEEKVTDDIRIPVYFPTYTAWSSKPGLMALTMRNHRNAVLGVMKREQIVPDVMYGHFLYVNGLTAVSVAQKYGIRSYIACGENSNRITAGSKPYSTGLRFHGWRKKLSRVNGVICVSTENKNLLMSNGFFDAKVPMAVIPNAVNTEVFRLRDKAEMRQKLGIDRDDFVVAFVGAFIQRKGADRVDAAVCGIDGIKTMFIGRGSFTPQSDCIHCGSVKHDQIPEYLSAADVFVLPTTGEGCCNAILEAMCCGLPIISSDGKFNDDILRETYSIRIDPMSVEQIRQAVLTLYHDRDRCRKMGQAVLDESHAYSLKARAQLVCDFIEEN